MLDMPQVFKGVVEKLVVGIRQQWGASNLATKTMIDSRFLT